MQSPTSITLLECYRELSCEQKPFAYKNHIKILSPLFNSPRKPPKASSLKMLFTLSDLKEKGQVVIKKWFDNYQRFEPVYELYSIISQTPTLPSSIKFLFLIQAIEAYYNRGDYKHEELDKKELNLRVERVLKAVPEDLNEWIKGKIKANYLSLKGKLENLMLKFSPIISTMFPVNSDFIDMVVTTRHYLTHYSKKHKSKAANDFELDLLAEKLKKY